MEKLQTRMILQEFHPFFSCCAEASEHVRIHEQLLDQLMEDTKGREMTTEESNTSVELQHYLHMNEVTAPIFGVTAAENFIHYYAVVTLASKHKYSVEHIDKLDTFTKWLIVPALSCGAEIDKSCTAMNDFNQLIQVRNSIVHPKPKIVNNFSEKQVESAASKVEALSKKRREVAKRAPKTFLMLVEALLKIDDSDTLRNIVASMALPIQGIEPIYTHENT